VIALTIHTVIAVICSADRNKHEDAVTVEYDDDGEGFSDCVSLVSGKSAQSKIQRCGVIPLLS